jgi:transcriptional regulator with XRE-family HTH domain
MLTNGVVAMDMKELGEKIRESRVETGLSQKALGEKFGLAQNIMSAIECGSAQRLTQNHRIIAEHFGIAIDEDDQEQTQEDQAEPVEKKPNGRELRSSEPRQAVLFRSIEHLKEVDILGRCCLDLQQLDAPQRARVLRYLCDLFGATD